MDAAIIIFVFLGANIRILFQLSSAFPVKDAKSGRRCGVFPFPSSQTTTRITESPTIFTDGGTSYGNSSYLCGEKVTTTIMAASILNKIEYLVLLVAAFAAQSKISEAEAYRYLSRYGALALCEKHYGIMHTLSLEENLQTLQEYCQKKGGTL
jgi:hypothetical protein